MNISVKDIDEFVIVVKEAYNNGYFTITDIDNYGCMGLHCETPNNGFYCLPSDAEDWIDTPEEYVKEVGIDNICRFIANTIIDMYEQELAHEDMGEAYGYILDLAKISNAPILKKLIDYSNPKWEAIDKVLRDMDTRYSFDKDNAMIEFWTNTAGQDVPTEFEYDGTPEDFVAQFVERANNYDVDEEVELYSEMRGRRGVPNTIREILEDCEEAKETLLKIADRLQKVIEEIE